MPQSLSKILVHIIFSTKNREPWLQDSIRDELHRSLATVLKGLDSPAIIIGSFADHVHIFCSLSKNQPVAKIVEKVKTSTSKWVKTKGAAYAGFAWQSGYGAFSVSESNATAVAKYVTNQKEHHRTKTFQEEYRAFLKKYGVAHDERYLWD